MQPINDLIGRNKELQLLQSVMKSRKPEFVAVYGRRRVGKTFLIREFFGYQFAFHISGLANATTEQQLLNFHLILAHYSHIEYAAQPQNWLIAFDRLRDYCETLPKSDQKIVFFIDELPWFDTPNSDFLIGLEHFWNGYASTRKDFVLITCGSAASWMIQTLIGDPGGLHNRVTQRLRVEPFTLGETEEMLKSRGHVLERYQIAQVYMALGGIPFYLDALKPEHSVAQNVQKLFFDSGGLLSDEFSQIFRSLFKNHDIYESIVEALSTKTYGVNRAELLQILGKQSGGSITKPLTDLEHSGFIKAYSSIDTKQKNTVYRLSDYFCNFYFRFIKPATFRGKDAWLKAIDHPAYRVWEGITFEQICIDHSWQIKKALGVQGVLSTDYSWRGTHGEESAQIDLLIDRRDQVVNLCEVKFSLSEWTIDADYAARLRRKTHIFKESTKTRKAVFLTMITTFGLTQNQYARSVVQNEAVLDDLFA
jgi:uncharacterized protein